MAIVGCNASFCANHKKGDCSLEYVELNSIGQCEKFTVRKESDEDSEVE